VLGASLGLAVWCEDEAGPFQAVPPPGGSWRPQGRPATRPHEYVRGGTCKLLTLFHPATGHVHLQPVGSCTNPVLHGWLKERLATMVATLVATLPAPAGRAGRRSRDPQRVGGLAGRSGGTLHLARRTAAAAHAPRVGQPRRPQDGRDGGLAVPARHHAALHPARRQLAEHGRVHPARPQAAHARRPAPAEPTASTRRADGQHPQSPAEIGGWFEQTAQAWNRQPTPFLWNGKRRQRRRKRPGDRHAIGGAAAHTWQPLPAHRSRRQEWQIPGQVTN
jgi:hypothetical protein